MASFCCCGLVICGSCLQGCCKTVTDTLAKCVLSPEDAQGFRCVVCKAADTHVSCRCSEEGCFPTGGSRFLSSPIPVTGEDPVVAIWRQGGFYACARKSLFYFKLLCK